MVQNRKVGKLLTPGGKSDPADKKLVRTAIRETYEETALRLGMQAMETVLYISIFEVKGVKMLDFGFYFRLRQSFEKMKLKRREGEFEEICFVPIKELCKSDDQCTAHAARIILVDTVS